MILGENTGNGSMRETKRRFEDRNLKKSKERKQEKFREVNRK